MPRITDRLPMAGPLLEQNDEPLLERLKQSDGQRPRLLRHRDDYLGQEHLKQRFVAFRERT